MVLESYIFLTNNLNGKNHIINPMKLICYSNQYQDKLWVIA